MFVVATANDVSALPPEFLRRGRFDELFFVDLPDYHARCTILALHLQKRERDPQSFDLATLSEITQGFSGAELEQVVVAALHRAFQRGREPSDADLRHAARDVVPLSRTYAEHIKDLREWAPGARPHRRPRGRGRRPVPPRDVGPGGFIPLARAQRGGHRGELRCGEQEGEAVRAPRR